MPCKNGSVRVINGDTFRTLKYIEPDDVPNEIEKLYQEGFEADTDIDGDIVFHEEEMEED